MSLDVMAEMTEAPKIKKSKDRSEKKKRKHVEENGAENISPSKKSKPNGHVPNGTSSTTQDGLQLAVDTQNGYGRESSSQSNDAATQATPRKEKKKSKSLQQATLSEDSANAQQPISDLETPSKKKKKKKKFKKHGMESNSQDLVSLSPKKGSKPKLSKDLAPAVINEDEDGEDSSLPMDIDAETLEPTDIPGISDEDPSPFISRTLRTIISTTSTSSDSTTSKSPFFRQAVQLYLPLSPITLPSPLEGLCAEHLSPLLLKYYPPLHAVILSYAQPRFSEESISDDGTPLAISVAEYSTPMIWVDVEFLIFKPERGHQVEGMIVLQSESYIGVQVYNLFSGRIPKDRLPKDWTWNGTDGKGKGKARKGKLKDGDGRHADKQQEVVEEEIGYWSDAVGVKIEGVIKIFVWDVEIALGGKEAERNLPTMEGTLLEEDLHESTEDADRATAKIQHSVKAGKRRAREASEL